MLWWILRWLTGPRGNGRRPQRQWTQPGRAAPVRVVSVQDGDSLVVRSPGTRGNEQYRVRLYAIDAPESDQAYGQEARDYLLRLVWNRNDLMLETVDTDRYGRLVGVLYYGAMDRRRSINRLMVEQGLAYWYSRYGGHGLGLEQAERNARGRRRGVWHSGGRVAPWEHRRQQRNAAARGGYLKWLLLALAIGAMASAAWLWLTYA